MSESKIVTLSGAPATQGGEAPSTQSEAAPGALSRPRLNATIIEQIAQQLNRLSELNKTTIVSRTTDAERAGIHAFLAEHMVVFGPELLGCWYTVRGEYEPLVRVIASITARVSGTIAQVRAAAAEQIEQTKPQDGAK